MNFTRVITIGVLFFLAGPSPGVVGADDKSGQSKMDGGHEAATCQPSTGHYLHHLLKHSKEIGLTADQVSKLKAIQLDLNRTRIKTEADMQVSELELAALTEDEKADLSAIETKAKERAMLEVGLQMAAIKAKRDAVSLLTPEQHEKVTAEREKMMKEMGGMMGKGEKEKSEGEKKKHMGGMMKKGMMGGKSGDGDPSPAQSKEEESHQH